MIEQTNNVSQTFGPQDWLTQKQAAEFSQSSQDTIRRMISRGELKAYRFGRQIRIKFTDLEKALVPVTNLHEHRLAGGDAA